jgi:hypothetical protein
MSSHGRTNHASSEVFAKIWMFDRLHVWLGYIAGVLKWKQNPSSRVAPLSRGVKSWTFPQSQTLLATEFFRLTRYRDCAAALRPRRVSVHG